MGRFRQQAGDEGVDASVDISPLLDCVFILLIFFIVTTTFVEESGVEVDKPQPGGQSAKDKENVVIVLTADGEVMYEGNNIGLGGVRTVVSEALRAAEDVPVVIQAETGVQTGRLMKLVNEARLGGADKVSIGTKRTS